MDAAANEFDVTGTVQVSSPDAVQDAVREIFVASYADANFEPLEHAFRDFAKLYQGELPGYKGCDTVYHDILHSLDMTLATARLIAGYEKAVPEDQRLGPGRATMGIITALFHDSGYILHNDDQSRVNGAEYTVTHVSRSAQFLEGYLLGIGLGGDAAVAGQVVHFTGYEIEPADIVVEDPKHRVIGQLLGTADLFAQMADRCYLEKCRDRLYPEFVLGGVAVRNDDDTGQIRVQYKSGLDLLRKTPQFFRSVTKNRLERDFEKAYKYFEAYFDGENPYLEAVRKNLRFLQYVLEGERWPLLRRNPPCFTSAEDTLEDTRKLVALKLREMRAQTG